MLVNIFIKRRVSSFLFSPPGSIVKRIITPACHAGVRSSTLRRTVHLQSKFTGCGTDLLSHVILYWDWVSITLLCAIKYVNYRPPQVGIRRWKSYHKDGWALWLGAYYEYKDNRIDSGWKAGLISCFLFFMATWQNWQMLLTWNQWIRKGMWDRDLPLSLWLWQTW